MMNVWFSKVSVLRPYDDLKVLEQKGECAGHTEGC